MEGYKKIRCKICKKKLHPLMKDVFTCKCKGIYCHNHRHSHNCSYDYIKERRDNLIKILPSIEVNKRLEKI
jgi:hypothetical protein